MTRQLTLDRNALFLGAPFNVVIFLIPQRFQVVNGTSPLGAGTRLLPFTCACPIGSIAASILSKKKVPPIYLVIAGSCLQVLGFALLSTAPTAMHMSRAQYGYQSIAGTGVGINIITLILMAPFCVEKRDRGTRVCALDGLDVLTLHVAVALGSVNQFRYMGAAVGLAITTTVLNSYVRSRLSAFLSQEEIGALLETSAMLSSFPLDVQQRIRSVFGHGYNIQMRILIGLAAAQLPASLVMWQRKQIVVK